MIKEYLGKYAHNFKEGASKHAVVLILLGIAAVSIPSSYYLPKLDPNLKNPPILTYPVQTPLGIAENEEQLRDKMFRFLLLD